MSEVQMERQSKLEIERAAYDNFLRLWDLGEFEGQRFGQAFYNHFRLHRITDQTLLHRLYNTDGKQALKVIGSVFQIP
ncbi:hypothetical protein [Pseudomonas sp. RA_105y_Pfl2_P56]|uniref:hypothetical protein n=1 Tax=Pseudomonas sp. RA_105y_Pfl2_P56 TaxID=3088701 RepID=UPI00403F30D8